MLAAGWQEWNSAHEGAGDTIHIDYDGDYASERVLIVSGRAKVMRTRGAAITRPWWMSFSESPTAADSVLIVSVDGGGSAPGWAATFEGAGP